MKQHGIMFALFGALAIVGTYITRGLRRFCARLAVYSAGAVLPLVIMCLALAATGVFGKFWFWTITYAREYVSERPLSVGMHVLFDEFGRLATPNLAIWLCGGLGLALIWLERKRRGVALWMTAFAALSFLAVCPGLYFRPHYFVMMLPAVALLAAGAISVLERAIPRLRAAVYVGFAIVISFCAYSQRQFLFRMTPFQATRSMYGLNPFPEAATVARYIRDHTPDNSQIGILGSEPEIPFYAHRHSATGYIYTYGLMESQPFAVRMQNEMIAELEAARPEYMVFVSVPTSWLATPQSATLILDWWQAYGREHYKLTGVANTLPDGEIDYRWNGLGSWRPRSPLMLAVYRRIPG